MALRFATRQREASLSRSPEYLNQDDEVIGFRPTVQPGAAMTVQGDEGRCDWRAPSLALF
jgi:hypothetical protein